MRLQPVYTLPDTHAARKDITTENPSEATRSATVDMADIIVDDEPHNNNNNANANGAGLQERLIGYVKTQKGFVLAAEMALSLVVLACYLWSPHWLLSAVPGVLAATTAAFFHVFLTGLDKQQQQHGIGATGAIHWPSADLCRALTGSALYLVASVAVVFQEDGAASGAFGLVAGVVFAYDAANAYLSLKSAGLQQNYNYNLGI